MDVADLPREYNLVRSVRGDDAPLSRIFVSVVRDLDLGLENLASHMLLVLGSPCPSFHF